MQEFETLNQPTESPEKELLEEYSKEISTFKEGALEDNLIKISLIARKLLIIKPEIKDEISEALFGVFNSGNIDDKNNLSLALLRVLDSEARKFDLPVYGVVNTNIG
jgi:hypothetical protein